MAKNVLHSECWILILYPIPVLEMQLALIEIEFITGKCAHVGLWELE